MKKPAICLSVFPSVFGLLLALTMNASALASPVGMAAHVQGSVFVSQSDAKKPLRLLNRLESGAVVTCGPSSNAIVVLFGNGVRYQIGPNSRATISAAGVSGAQKMPELGGPSAGAVKLLGNARVGAVMARPPITWQRLQPPMPGTLIGPRPRFDWQPLEGAKIYNFTLFDDSDNVVWSLRTREVSADFPAELPVLEEKTPYLWRLSGFKENGQPVGASRWGILTVLSPQDARLLEQTATQLKEQAKTAADNTPLLLLAEAYRSYGVLNGTLEVLDDLKNAGDASADEALSDIYASLSPFARALAEHNGLFVPYEATPIVSTP